MKAIKYRTWDKTRKILCHVVCIQWEEGNICDVFVQKTNSDDFVCLKINNCNLMQYTGLRDKNDKEIYEGDLFKIGIEKDVFEVRFERGCFLGYRNNQQIGLIGELQNCFIEIIGNIYENPELLKEQGK